MDKTEKAKKTREENEKKLFDLMGYEIKKDALQFIAVKNGRCWYYPSLLHLFRDFRTLNTDHKIESGLNLSELVENLEKRDKVFLDEVSGALKGLPEALR